MITLKPVAKGKVKTAELLIYDEIGNDWWGDGLTAKSFASDLTALGDIDEITVRINSYGGEVMDGIAIATALETHPAKVNVRVDGIAASIATVIAVQGDTVTMASNGFWMIHNPLCGCFGHATELRKQADILDKIGGSMAVAYVNGSSLGLEEIQAAMEVETWYTAEEAMEAGFVLSLTSEIKLAACGDKTRFKRLPESLLTIQTASATGTPKRDRAREQLSKMQMALTR